MVAEAISFAEKLAALPSMSLAQAEALYVQQEDDNPVPEQALCGETVDHVANNEDDSVCRRCGAELVYDNPVPETFVQDVVEAETQEQFSRYPRNTETGPVCGNCTHRDGAGDRVIMRHATTQDVRDCYAARYDEEQAVLAEIEAEKRAERFYEEGF
jgi:hypothetical protein